MSNQRRHLTEVPAQDPADAELLTAHVNGDPEAFNELARRHHRYLRAVARRALPDGNDVDDVVQVAMIAALRAAPEFEHRASVRTWLHRITVNAALDARRRDLARPQTTPYDDADELAECTDLADAVAGQLVADELLAALPPVTRQLVIMVDLLGFSVADTARVLGMAEGTVKSRRARAFARLVYKLQP